MNAATCLAAVAASLLACAPLAAQQPAGPQTEAKAPTAAEVFEAEAAAMAALVTSNAGREFLRAAGSVPQVEPRTIYFRRDPKTALTSDQWSALPEADRAAFKAVPFDTARYYATFYGTPLAYARALDLVGAAGIASWSNLRVMDFGYGTVGHLRMLASRGAQVVGVDVDPILVALYSTPGDTGAVEGPDGRRGSIALMNGYWPRETAIVDSVRAHGPYDLIISKNTLKKGYVHPSRPVDPARTLQLGVEDTQFVHALFDSLAPGGLVMIYNIGPGQPVEPDKYIPWAEIACPFPRAEWEAAGFEVLAFDVNDDGPCREQARALKWDEQGMDIDSDTFAMYSLFRRPGAAR